MEEQKRQIALRLFAQLFRGELLPPPSFGPQLVVSSILQESEELEKIRSIDQLRTVFDLADANIKEARNVLADSLFIQ